MCSARRLGAGRACKRAGLSDKVSVDNLWLPPEARHGPAADDFSLRHHHHRVAQALDHVQLVLDHQDRQASTTEVLQVVLNLLADLWMNAGPRPPPGRA